LRARMRLFVDGEPALSTSTLVFTTISSLTICLIAGRRSLVNPFDHSYVNGMDQSFGLSRRYATL
jgi:hypothetical protein